MMTKKTQSQGAQAKLTAKRLEMLRREADLTLEGFAQTIARRGQESPAHTTCMAWRNGKSVPGGEYLRAIAERYGVTTDWLLGIKDAPQYRDQGRTTDDLAADLAAHVGRAVALHLEQHGVRAGHRRTVARWVAERPLIEHITRIACDESTAVAQWLQLLAAIGRALDELTAAVGESAAAPTRQALERAIPAAPPGLKLFRSPEE
jgi:transcriptional regulator with XRE-family HTH domain